MYCNNIPKVVYEFDFQNTISVNGDFMDASERSLKAILHNGNVVGSVPFAHSVLPEDSYENVETLLSPGSSTRNVTGKFVAISEFYLCYWVSDLDTPSIHALCASGEVQNDLVAGSRRSGRLETN